MSANISSSVFPVLLCVLFAGAATGAQDRDGLKGPVKSVVTEAAAYSGTAGKCSEAKRTVQRRARYNADGNCVESTDYNPDGSIFKRDVSTYDESGGRQSKASYDTAGLLVEKQTFDPKNAGRLVSVESYKKDGSINSTATWQYNDQGQRIGVQGHDSSGNLTRSVSFNAAQQMTESDDYKDGVLVGKQVLNYDVNGNLLEVLRYGGDGRSPIDGLTEPTRLVNSYDSAGHLVERKEFKPDGSMWRQTLAFDKNRNEAEHSVYDQAGLLKSHMTYTYEYDSAGNWTVQKMSDEVSDTCSHPIRVVYRTITYY